MRYILSSDEMKKADKKTSDYFGISSVVLMERAAIESVHWIENRFEKNSRILVVAGCGNNGGDGIAIARILNQEGYRTELATPFTGRRTELMQEQLDIYNRYHFPLNNNLPDDEYDIIIDSIFGIGLSRDIVGEYKEWILTLNQLRGKKISIDISSGLNADNGSIMGECLKADYTIAFSYIKRGHVLGEGKRYTGELVCLPIGITDEAVSDKEVQLFFFEPCDIKWPKRKETVNKGTCGKLFIVAGNSEISGAAVLAAKAAYRIGTGMVKVLTHQNNKNILASAVPECLLTTYEKEIQTDDLNKNLNWCDAVLIGPGLGTNQISGEILDFIMSEFQGPVILDADAINLIALSDKRKELLRNRRDKHLFTVLLPHIMEFSRLIGCSVQEIKANVVDKAIKFVSENGTVLVLKDATTLVCMDDKTIYVPKSGNSALATAGTGDVLAGMVSGLVTQGIKNEQSLEMCALYSACLHGVIADEAVKKGNNQYSFMAGDLCDQMKETLGEYLS